MEDGRVLEVSTTAMAYVGVANTVGILSDSTLQQLLYSTEGLMRDHAIIGDKVVKVSKPQYGNCSHIMSHCSVCKANTCQCQLSIDNYLAKLTANHPFQTLASTQKNF